MPKFLHGSYCCHAIKPFNGFQHCLHSIINLSHEIQDGGFVMADFQIQWHAFQSLFNTDAIETLQRRLGHLIARLVHVITSFGFVITSQIRRPKVSQRSASHQDSATGVVSFAAVSWNFEKEHLITITLIRNTSPTENKVIFNTSIDKKNPLSI